MWRLISQMTKKEKKSNECQHEYRELKVVGGGGREKSILSPVADESKNKKAFWLRVRL